jgi:hypothetical protein
VGTPACCGRAPGRTTPDDPPDAGVAGCVCDATHDFAYAVPLLAALEGATGEDGHAEALPFLGIARAELVDFGRRPEGIAAAR